MITRDDFEREALGAIDQAFANQWWVNLNEDIVERIRDNLFDAWSNLCDTPPNSEQGEAVQTSHNSDYKKFSGSDIKNAYIAGYETGHNDTVESCYGCSEDKAVDYLEEPENFS